MTDVGAEPVTPRALGARVRHILFAPKSEWPVIEAEPATIRSLYANYICILAAIPPLAQALSSILFGRNGVVGITYRPPVLWVFAAAVVEYVLALIGVFVMALIIDALAPMFGGRKDKVQSLKLAAYSSTAFWLTGIFQLAPPISLLSFLGLYSFYLLYKGLPVMTKAAGDKALTYTAVVVVVSIVLSILVGALVAPVVMLGVSSPTSVLIN